MCLSIEETIIRNLVDRENRIPSDHD